MAKDVIKIKLSFQLGISVMKQKRGQCYVWQALPERRHLVIAILGKLKTSLNDVGMSAGYLAPAIAQIMAIRLDLVIHGVLQFFSFFFHAYGWRVKILFEKPLSWWFFKCLIRISLASQSSVFSLCIVYGFILLKMLSR